MGLSRWLTYKLRLFLYDVAEYIEDIRKFNSNTKFAIIEETAGKLNTGSLGKKVAIVAIYPSSEILFSIRNICSALSKNDYSILLVSSSRVAPGIKEQLLDRCTFLFERPGFGRDFGSYAAAINWLKTHGKFGSLESLILANDSMFWPSDFSSEIHLLDSVDSDWKCLFEHQKVGKVHKHAQSFFLIFSRKVLNHPSFQKYWSEYTPWSARKHLIFEGEIGLSKCLLKAKFRPYVAYNFPRIWSALLKRINANTVDQPLRLALFDVLNVDFMERHTSNISLVELEKTSQLGHLDQLIWNTVSNISDRLFQQSPSHATGLLSNILLGAPLKQDFCAKYGRPIGIVIATAQGFNNNDMQDLHAALIAKGSRSQYDDFEEFLLNRGRL